MNRRNRVDYFLLITDQKLTKKTLKNLFAKLLLLHFCEFLTFKFQEFLEMPQKKFLVKIRRHEDEVDT